MIMFRFILVALFSMLFVCKLHANQVIVKTIEKSSLQLTELTAGYWNISSRGEQKVGTDSHGNPIYKDLVKRQTNREMDRAIWMIELALKRTRRVKNAINGNTM